MTIKKIGLSLAVLATVASTSAFAGTLSLDTNASVMAAELVQGQDYNGTNDNGVSVDINSTYIPSLNAGVNDGKMMIEFKGGRIHSSMDLNTLHLYNRKQATEIGDNPRLAGSDEQKLIFDINGSINDADPIVLSIDDNGTNSDGNLSTSDTNATVLLDVLNNSSSVTMQYSLLDNVDQLRDDSGAKKAIDLQTQWSVATNSLFDAQIDAAQAFKLFTTTNSTGTTTDTAGISFTSNPNIDIGTGAATANIYTMFDNNVSAFGTMTTPNGSAAVIKDANGFAIDENATTSTVTAGDYNLTFTATGKDKILDTVFTTTAKITSFTGNTNFTGKTYLEKTSLGAWTTYGYKAQIPDVMSITGKFITYLKFTNRSSIPSEVFFTLIDQNGKTATVNSLDNGIASLPKGTTVKYRASDLIIEALKVNPDLDVKHSISIEVTIPTTPSKVYGMASLKNVALGQFKDLPIYNNSNLSY